MSMTYANKTQSKNFSPATSTTSEISNDWLLPDGVHDVLFNDADKQQHLRHRLIQRLQSHGYELVTPPMIEFTESLLGNASEDLKRQTFKIIDQLTGRLMGVRADTTPQILRIDANQVNSQQTNGSGNYGIARYCYAGHTIHTLPTGLFGLRTPLQLGAEIFGTDSIQADFELLDILCGLFADLDLQAKIHLDLGHVGIFRRLSELAQLSEDSIEQLMQLYDNKALPELKFVCQDLPMGEDFYALARYGHDLAVLKEKLSPQAIGDTEVVSAIEELQQIYQHLASQQGQQTIDTAIDTGITNSSKASTNSSIDISIDVADLSAYHYHSGMMFNVYMNDGSQALVRGGRFDGSANEDIDRPAIGFSMDVTRLLPFFELVTPSVVLVDFADYTKVTAQSDIQVDTQANSSQIDNEQKNSLMQKVAELRSQNYRVVIPLSADDKPNGVSHVLTLDGEWVLRDYQ